MKYFFIVLTVIVIPIISCAQTPEDSVMAVINKMFAGMKNADAELMKGCFADSAILQTIVTNKDGSPQIRNENISAFVEFISKLAPGAADERIRFETIKIDGPLAMAWTPYEFYFEGKFSHCGVDSFQLVRITGQWKIQYLIDTRRKQGCI